MSTLFWKRIAGGWAADDYTIFHTNGFYLYGPDREFLGRFDSLARAKAAGREDNIVRTR